MKAESAILPGIQKPMTLWGLPIQLALVNVCGAMTVLGFFLAIQLTPLAPFAAIGCFIGGWIFFYKRNSRDPHYANCLFNVPRFWRGRRRQPEGRRLLAGTPQGKG